MLNLLEKINLGGVEQWVLIRGMSFDNPIIMFLHGGPGFPIMPFHQYFQRPLEERFTVVHWDQRGAGKSYNEDIPSDTMTLNQILADAVELIDMLLHRFNKEKVYIAGHSWGSIVGINFIKSYSHKVLAYIGIGQVVDYPKSMEIYYDYALNSAKNQMCYDIVEELDRIGKPPFDDDAKLIATLNIVERFGGGLHNFISFRDIASKCMDYTEQDILNVSKGLAYSAQYLWNTVMETEFFTQHTRFDVPIYLFNGRHDFKTPTSLVEKYYNRLDVPKKKLIIFENSAHFPFIEEPDRFCREMVKIAYES